MASKAWEALMVGLEAFGAGMQGRSPQLAQMLQQKQMAQLHLDAEFGTRGYERMDDNEIKEYLRNQKLSGFAITPKVVDTPIGQVKIDSGSVGLPEGAKWKDGVIYDKKGNQIGEYAEGYEPKQMKQISQSTGDVLNLQGNFYKWNPELAKKMGKTVPATAEEIASMAEKLQGNFLPAYIKTGAGTYRYQPTPTEKWGMGQQPDFSQQPMPIVSPTQQVSPMSFPNQEQNIMERAIMNAIANKVPKADIIKGIQDEGYNPKDYERILATYDPSIPPLRRDFLGNLLLGAGLAPTDQLTNIIKAISNEVDKKKAVYSPTSGMLAQQRGR